MITNSSKGYFENSWRNTEILPSRRIVYSIAQIANARRIEVTGLSKDGTARSPDALSVGIVVASGELCLALAVGTTSRRNRQWPRAWHPGPSDNPAGRHWELKESKLRAEGGARRTRKRERGDSWWGMCDTPW